ncbi:unnamed protein product, partial [Meganyctiphanes norvegica]
MSEYSDEDFIHLFNTLFEIRVTVQDMRALKADFVQKIYYLFLKDFGANLESINQFPFDVSESVSQHPELYREAVRIMTLAKVIRLFFKMIYNEESFQPADLFYPKPKRTRRFFKMVVDFYFGANNHIEDFTEIEEKVSLKIDGRKKMLEGIEKLKTKIGDSRQQNSKYQIQEDEMQKRISSSQHELSEAHVIKQGLKNQLDKLKMENLNVANSINDGKIHIIEAKERIENLAGQVVQESEKRDIEEREHQLSTYRDTSNQKQSRMDELKKSMKSINTANNLMKDNLLSLMKEIKEAKEKESEYSNFIDQIEREKSTNLEEIEDILMKLQQFQEQLLSRQERISQINLAWSIKKESLKEEVNQNKMTLEEIRRSQSEDDIAAQDLEAEQVEMEKEMVAIQEQIKHFDHFVATKYQAILQAMETQNNDLEGLLTDLTISVNRRN